LVIARTKQWAAVCTAVFLALSSTGLAGTRSQQVEAALPSLERTYRQQPDTYANAWNLALAYFETGRLEKARVHIRTLLTKWKMAELHNLLGAVEEKQLRHEDAAREYEAAARMEPNEKNLGDWAGFLLRRAALDASIQVYGKAIELHPKSAALRIGLGLAHHGRGEYDEAMESICAAVDLDPNDPRPIVFLGSLADTSPRLAPVVTRRLKSFARLYPRNAQAQLYYALALWKEAERQSAPLDVGAIEKHLSAAAALDASSFEARLQLGILYERAGRDKEAIPVLIEAARLQPESEAVHYRLARVYQRTGQSELAKREFERYRRLRRPADPR
jgi:tetratricopeptide (TPR) repeat protein